MVYGYTVAEAVAAANDRTRWSMTRIERELDPTALRGMSLWMEA